MEHMDYSIVLVVHIMDNKGTMEVDKTKPEARDTLAYQDKSKDAPA
jgi:hypothetical protein